MILTISGIITSAFTVMTGIKRELGKRNGFKVMAGCGYTWGNNDPDAERDSNGNKVHPNHTCRNSPHGIKVKHLCKCGAQREKTQRNR